ncbi:MAG: hypothetical protein ACXW30_03365 [Micavibrio sp.]
MAFNEMTPITPKRDDLLPTALDVARIEVEQESRRAAQEDDPRAAENHLRGDISSTANGFSAQNLSFSALYAHRDNGLGPNEGGVGEGKKSDSDLDLAMDQARARNIEMIARINRRLAAIQREIEGCDQRLTEIADLRADALSEYAELEAEQAVAQEQQNELEQSGVQAAQVTATAENSENKYLQGFVTITWNEHGHNVAKAYQEAGVGEEFALLDRHRRGEAVDPQKLQEAREKIEQTGLTSDMRTAMRGWLRENVERAQIAEYWTRVRIDENGRNLERINTRLQEIGTELEALTGEERAVLENRERLTAEAERLNEDRRRRMEYEAALTDPGYRQRVAEKRGADGSWYDAATCIENDYLGVCSAPASFNMDRTSAAGAEITTGVPVQAAFTQAASNEPAAPEPSAPIAPTQDRRPVLAAAAPGQ